MASGYPPVFSSIPIAFKANAPLMGTSYRVSHAAPAQSNQVQTAAYWNQPNIGWTWGAAQNIAQGTQNDQNAFTGQVEITNVKSNLVNTAHYVFSQSGVPGIGQSPVAPQLLGNIPQMTQKPQRGERTPLGGNSIYGEANVSKQTKTK